MRPSEEEKRQQEFQAEEKDKNKNTGVWRTPFPWERLGMS